MTSPYKAAFVIPASCKRTLDDDGWTFESDVRLPSRAIDVLVRAFKLHPKTTYSGVVRYIGDGVQATVILDDAGAIEIVSLQLNGRGVQDVRAALTQAGLNQLEVFAPVLD